MIRRLIKKEGRRVERSGRVRPLSPSQHIEGLPASGSHAWRIRIEDGLKDGIAIRAIRN
jgi:hypothetical protein